MILSYVATGILFAFGILMSVKYRQLQERTSREKESVSQKLHDSDEILQKLGTCFFLIDKNFVVQKTNYYTLNRLPEDKSIKRVGDLLHCKNAVEAGGCGMHEHCKLCGIRAKISCTFEDGKDFSRFEASMKLLSADRQQILPCDVYVSGTCLNIDGGFRVLLTINDISELKNVERLLLLEKENVLSCDKLKASFIENMSHEVRTPLNAIVGFSSLLATASDKEEKDMYIDIINQNNDRLLKLINDILDLSQIDSGTLNFQYSDFDVNDLLRELYELFKFRLKEKPDITLLCEAGLDPIMIRTERQRVMQVLINLLTNAMKFTQQGEIRFGCQLKEDNEIYFFVTDTGSGIPEDERDKIFNRFIKLDREIPGTGLGLTLSQTIVEKLGGRIGVESQQGIGSTFWFAVPLGAYD